MMLRRVGWVEILWKFVFEDKNVLYFWVMVVLCGEIVFCLFFEIFFKYFLWMIGFVRNIFYIVFFNLVGRGWLR